MAALQLGQGVPYHFLRQTRTFPTFAGNAGCLAYFPVAAAAVQNRIPDLTVGNTLAETYIHKWGTVAGD